MIVKSVDDARIVIKADDKAVKIVDSQGCIVLRLDSPAWEAGPDLLPKILARASARGA